MEEIEQLSPMFKGEKGNRLANRLLHLTGIDRLSEIYARHEDLAGPEFIRAYLQDLGLNYVVEGLDRLGSVANGPFVTVSNHPYGALDGLFLIDLFGHLRDDYKVMANKFLTLVKTLKDSFISVIPNTNDAQSIAKESLAGVRQAMRHVADGHPLGVFPAGAVSDFHFRDFKVSDREWQPSAIRLIRKLQVPVVPVRFLDRNSSWFYFLGLINWKIRTMRLPKEVLNKAGKTVRISIGEVIDVERQKACQPEQFGTLLRESVYNS